MEIKKHYLILSVFIAPLLIFCQTEKITLCGSRCSASTPWKVESLDLGLPCFGTKDACEKWAATHGYSTGECVKCD